MHPLRPTEIPSLHRHSFTLPPIPLPQAHTVNPNPLYTTTSHHPPSSSQNHATPTSSPSKSTLFALLTSYERLVASLLHDIQTLRKREEELRGIVEEEYDWRWEMDREGTKEDRHRHMLEKEVLELKNEKAAASAREEALLKQFEDQKRVFEERLRELEDEKVFLEGELRECGERELGAVEVLREERNLWQGSRDAFEKVIDDLGKRILDLEAEGRDHEIVIEVLRSGGVGGDAVDEGLRERIRELEEELSSYLGQVVGVAARAAEWVDDSLVKFDEGFRAPVWEGWEREMRRDEMVRGLQKRVVDMGKEHAKKGVGEGD
ncbi:hypothetical protein HDV00_000738 [Rhizophlyctis rosea]|nr:hypothetical protein HDV00_000738 [Rhizophlyctis rosea]